jgi:SAM-dependent methyltransferase
MREALPSLRRLYERYGNAAVETQLAALERHGDLIDDPELWLETALAGDFKFMAIERVQRCPCGSDHSTHISRFLYWNLLGMRRCDRCGVIFVSPRLTSEAMASVFAEHYFDYNDLATWGERREPVFAEIMSMLTSRNVKSVLDVGAAYGHFVRYAQQRGLRAAGTDISAKAVEIGREKLGVDLHAGRLSELAIPEGSFDAVVSLDALYYSADPRAELDAMRRVVKPGGILILRLRNSFWSRAFARITRFGAISRAILPAPHLWGYTPTSIEQLLEVSGWRTEECSPAAYSSSRIAPVQSIAASLNRAATRAWRNAPVLTRSFNVVARLAE